MMEMSYVLVRMFQIYSRVELRMEETGTVKKQESEWLRRGNDPELVEKYMKNRPRMVSEIMLYPRSEIRVAFIK